MKLKGTAIGVNEHFPPEVVKIRRGLIPIYKEARKQKLKASLRRDKLYIEGELFDEVKHKNLIVISESVEMGAEGGGNTD